MAVDTQMLMGRSSPSLPQIDLSSMFVEDLVFCFCGAGHGYGTVGRDLSPYGKAINMTQTDVTWAETPWGWGASVPGSVGQGFQIVAANSTHLEPAPGQSMSIYVAFNRGSLAFCQLIEKSLWNARGWRVNLSDDGGGSFTVYNNDYGAAINNYFINASTYGANAWGQLFVSFENRADSNYQTTQHWNGTAEFARSSGTQGGRPYKSASDRPFKLAGGDNNSDLTILEARVWIHDGPSPFADKPGIVQDLFIGNQ